ncbi:glycosyltransferase family 2 protein [Acidobacteriota bacterium]
MKTLILVPAYNEEKVLGAVLAEIKADLPESDILVVNDGSSDRTQEVLGEIPDVFSLHLSSNLGIGGAIQAGFHFFLQKSYDTLLRIDGDGQHPPEQAGALLDSLNKSDADLVIGSRFIEKKGYQSSFGRRGGIKLLNILTSSILQQRITDNTSGFRAYNRRAIEHLVHDYPFDYPEPIEVYRLAKDGFRITEIPVLMRARQGGLTSINQLDSYLYLIKVLVTIFFKYSVGGNK